MNVPQQIAFERDIKASVMQSTSFHKTLDYYYYYYNAFIKCHYLIITKQKLTMLSECEWRTSPDSERFMGDLNLFSSHYMSNPLHDQLMCSTLTCHSWKDPISAITYLVMVKVSSVICHLGSLLNVSFNNTVLLSAMLQAHNP